MKAQSSIEFMIIIGALLFIFSGFLFVINQNVSEKQTQQRTIQMQQLAESVQTELNLAAESSDGYQRTFTIQQQISGENFTLNITAGSLYFRTLDGKNALALPAPKLQGQLVKGANTIRKVNGTILVNQ